MTRPRWYVICTALTLTAATALGYSMFRLGVALARLGGGS